MKIRTYSVLLLTIFFFFSCNNASSKKEFLPKVKMPVNAFIPLKEAAEIEYTIHSVMPEQPYVFTNTSTQNDVSILNQLDNTEFHYYQGLKFKNDDFGVLVGGTGLRVRITKNGGENWKEIRFSRFSNAFQSVDFSDKNIFIVGANQYIFKSNDFGENWSVFDTKYFFKDDNSRYQTFKYYKVRFFNSKIGFIVGARKNEPIILKTLNGGETWELIKNDTLLKEDKGISDIAVFSPNDIMITTLSGKCYKSINGGVTWQLLFSRTNNALSSIGFFNSSTGFIGGLNNLCMYTNDSGTSWKPVHIPYGEVSDIGIHEDTAFITSAFMALEEAKSFVFKADIKGEKIEPFLTKKDSSVFFKADSYGIQVLNDNVYILDRNNLYKTNIN
ncbi:hypothetical protein FNB79_07830 [Formosa sediminum]|uniref:Photosynthesis system II assembly factor Ycf48/Hcf136-like domain-containing protein n=1 Tax=Formosa sediminum TaxID=2594004 RepID=A0A516GQW0_9FLAO|nr:YCF48-related protein [Formosa sediminum]QDO93896.1 hypothetical protein FNB79_07830 [Formosa sediminum]